MIVLDPGHRYLLFELDGVSGGAELVFVKREGPKYPGNVGSHPGTNLQDVLRACMDRVSYLEGQVHDFRNEKVKMHLRAAIQLLEFRAADRHGRPDPTLQGHDVVHGTFCGSCGHIGCEGFCKVAA